MIVLSCFDGMSCGQVALRGLRIPIEKYYSSEIDKFAIHNTQYNLPDTVQLGNINEWRSWKIPWGSIDLLLGGSPCQDVSMAGLQKGLQDGTRSNLFYVWVDILRHIQTYNPNVKFLLENVRMKKSFLKLYNEALGLYPMLINSASVSAQNRERYYWTNIRTKLQGLFGDVYTDIPQPADKGMRLKDILCENVPERYFLKDNVIKKLLAHLERNITRGNGFGAVFHDGNTKMSSLKVGGKGFDDLVLIFQRPRGANMGGIFKMKTPTVSSNSFEQNNLVVQMKPSRKSGGKYPVLMYGRGGYTANILTDYIKVRRLTPTECARLQTIPDWYKWNVSETQQYKMLDNGWTVDVIKHILSFMEPLL